MAKKPVKETIHAKGFEIGIYTTDFENEYISLTDIARYKSDDPNDVIKNWLRGRETIEFLGLWESLHNPNFKPVEFDGFRMQAGLNAFTMSPTKWINGVNAIGIVSKAGRYGGTYAHADIAFEFASWISAMVHNPQLEKAIKDKIGTVVDTTDMQKELEVYRQQLRQILTTKARLEKQMDSLDVTDPHYDRKIIDLQRRYDAQYDIMGEIEGHIDELEEQILAIRKSRYPEIMYISSCWPLMNSMRNLRTSRNAMCFELSSR